MPNESDPTPPILLPFPDQSTSAPQAPNTGRSPNSGQFHRSGQSHRSGRSPNVAQRLAQAIGTAKEMGFEVRKVVFADQVPGWCQIGTKKILFLDLTASTSEQLAQIDEIIASYCNERSDQRDGKLAG